MSCLSYLVSSEEGDYYEQTLGNDEDDSNDEESDEDRDGTDDKNVEQNGERRNDTEGEGADNKKAEQSEKANKDSHPDFEEKTKQDGVTSKDHEASTTDKKTEKGGEPIIQPSDSNGEDNKTKEKNYSEADQRIKSPGDDVKSIDKDSD